MNLTHYNKALLAINAGILFDNLGHRIGKSGAKALKQATLFEACEITPDTLAQCLTHQLALKIFGGRGLTIVGRSLALAGFGACAILAGKDLYARYISVKSEDSSQK